MIPLIVPPEQVGNGVNPLVRFWQVRRPSSVAGHWRAAAGLQRNPNQEYDEQYLPCGPAAALRKGNNSFRLSASVVSLPDDWRWRST